MTIQQPAAAAGSASSTVTPSIVMCLGIIANTVLPIYIFICLQWLDLGTDNDPSFWSRALTFSLDNYDQYVAKLVQYGLGGTAIGLAMQAALKTGSWSPIKMIGVLGLIFSCAALAVAAYVLFQLNAGGAFQVRITEVPYTGKLPALGPIARSASLQSIDTMVMAVTGAIGFSTWKIGQ